MKIWWFENGEMQEKVFSNSMDLIPEIERIIDRGYDVIITDDDCVFSDMFGLEAFQFLKYGKAKLE